MQYVLKNRMIACLLLLVLAASHLLTIGNAEFRMFFTLEQALDFFRNDTSKLASSIHHTFENDCRALDQEFLPTFRKPFIVIEGNYVKSRNLVGVRLSRKMRGRYLVHPAHCLQRFARDIPRGTLFRRAFYILSMYAMSFDVKLQLSLGRSVVLNGYWWDTLTFALVQAFPPETTPKMTDPVFSFPEDLLQPDLVFYLNLRDSLHYQQITTRNPKNWKPRVLKIYRELQDTGRPVVIQDLSALHGKTVETVFDKILANLSTHRDVQFDSTQGINFDYRDE